MSGHTTTPAAGHEEHTAGNKKSLGVLVVGIILLSVFAVTATKCSRDSDTTTTSTSSQHRQKVDPIPGPSGPKIEVDFGEKYGEELIIRADDVSFHFVGATQAYCVRNAAGTEVCRNKGQGVANLLGFVEENRRIQFKSRDGQPGHLTIELERSSR